MSESSLVNNFFGFSIFKLCKNVYLPTFPQKCLQLYISLKLGLVYYGTCAGTGSSMRRLGFTDTSLQYLPAIRCMYFTSTNAPVETRKYINENEEMINLYNNSP